MDQKLDLKTNLQETRTFSCFSSTLEGHLSQITSWCSPFSEANRPPASWMDNVQEHRISEQCLWSEEMFFQVDFCLWFQEIFNLPDWSIIVLLHLPLDFFNRFEFIKEARAFVFFLWLDRGRALWNRDLCLSREITLNRLCLRMQTTVSLLMQTRPVIWDYEILFTVEHLTVLLAFLATMASSCRGITGVPVGCLRLCQQ